MIWQRNRSTIWCSPASCSRTSGPGRAVEQMVRTARPGGVVVVEDIEFAAHFSYPVCPAFKRYVSLYQQVVRRRGGDPDIGPRLFGLPWTLAWNRWSWRWCSRLSREGPGKLMAQVTMENSREAVVGEGLATDGEVDAILSGLDAFARNPRTILSMAGSSRSGADDRRRDEPLTGPHDDRLGQVHPAAVADRRRGDQAQPLAGCGVELEDRDLPPGLDAFEVEAGDDPVVGEAEGEVRVTVERDHR